MDINKHKKRFNSKVDYANLLKSVFSDCAQIMAEESTVYVRTDSREFTYQTTLEILTTCFPKHRLTTDKKPFLKHTQTALFNAKPAWDHGEVDIVLIKS